MTRATQTSLERAGVALASAETRVRDVRQAARSAAFMFRAHRALVGHAPPVHEAYEWMRLVRRSGKGELLQALATSDHHVEHVLGQLDFGSSLDDDEWINYAYTAVLGRPPDPGGMQNAKTCLRNGMGRREFASHLVRSEEHINRTMAAAFEIAEVRAKRPQHYVELPDKDGQPTLLLRCSDSAVFDWIESEIVRNGYYEKPGIWSFLLSQDKQVMAELIASLEPSRVLEIGCSNGTILSCLAREGIFAEGIDLSAAAIAKADPIVRDQIHLGDVLAVELDGAYDVVFGLDIFEHLNPNRLGAYLSKLASQLRVGGYLLANIPVFGSDPVFGCLFDRYIPGWDEDSESGRPFALLPVDAEGYPFHGHLVWADAAWWVKQFEGIGLTREIDLERALHDRYDAYWVEVESARRSFFIFSNQADEAATQALAARIRSIPSRVVDGPRSLVP